MTDIVEKFGVYDHIDVKTPTGNMIQSRRVEIGVYHNGDRPYFVLELTTDFAPAKFWDFMKNMGFSDTDKVHNYLSRSLNIESIGDTYYADPLVAGVRMHHTAKISPQSLLTRLSRRVESVPDDTGLFSFGISAADGSKMDEAGMEYLQKIQDTAFGNSQIIREIRYADFAVVDSRLKYVIQASHIPGIEQRLDWLMSNTQQLLRQ